MISADMTYGALSAKVRALYGKRLLLSDFERLAALKTPQEILEYLRLHPGWSRAVERLAAGPGSYVGRIELEAVLQEELRLDYLGLHHFVPRQDRDLMHLRVRAAERDAILGTLRRLRVGKYAKPLPADPIGLLPQSTLDYPALRAAGSYDQVLEAAKHTIYYPVLHHLRPGESDPLPDYTTAESLLDSAYLSYTHRLIDRRYRGQTRKALLESFGRQADLSNLMHILRLKTYFPDTPTDFYLTILSPFHYRLSPATIRSLCTAASVEDFFTLVRETPYADSFESTDPAEVERRYRHSFYAFHRRQLMTGPPSICVALAYLNLKQAELRLLVNIIESVKYGAAYDVELARLMGT